MIRFFILCCCGLLFIVFVSSFKNRNANPHYQQLVDSIPPAYLKDSLPVLINRCKDLLEHAYMAQTLLAETDTIPGWEGFPVKLYAYKTSNDLYTGKPKTGKVYLLNPSPEKLAMWIVTTSWEVKKSVDPKYINKIFQTVKG